MSAEQMLLHDKTEALSSKTRHLQVTIGGYSCAGCKAVNQDAFAALIPSVNDILTKGIVATLADGVSSSTKAAEAAQLSVTQFISDYYATPDTWSIRKSAAKVLTSLNQWLYCQADSLHNQSQQWLTTFSALILKSSTAYIFHVGDSRISQFRHQQLEAITTDHNQKQGRNHVVLTRALGADPRLKVDVHQLAVQVGDIYLLTCDGVHDYLSDQQLKLLLKRLPEQPSKKILTQLSQQIVTQAIEQGSTDNVSCLLVAVQQTPDRELVEIERDLLSKVIPPPLTVGMTIDNYKICKIIHASIRSHLYLVEHPEEAQPLVLKVPSQNLTDDVFYRQGFSREAWLGERVDHPHLMKIKGANHQSRFLYHVCEFIDGQTLSDWMFDNPNPSIAQVRDIIAQVILVLRVFQRLELVHRDLKPENLMIDVYGKITLIDYGTVRIAAFEEQQDNLTATIPQGTLNYIAPETLRTLHADHQSDLFSLGVIAYEMLCGHLPYPPKSRAEVINRHYQQWHYQSVQQYRNDLPLWLDLALKKATEADPKLRYQAFSEFQADINTPNLLALQAYKKQPLIERHPVQFWKSVALLLFIALVIALTN